MSCSDAQISRTGDFHTTANDSMQACKPIILPLVHVHEVMMLYTGIMLNTMSCMSIGAEYYNSYERALQSGLHLTLRYLRFLYFGPARSGKTTLRRRLINEIINLSSLGEPSISTGIAETNDVIIKKLTSEPAVIIDSQWQSVNRSDPKERSKCNQLGIYGEGEVRYQLHMILKLISKHTTMSNDQLIDGTDTFSSDSGICYSSEISSILSDSEDAEIKKIFETLTNILQSDSPEELKQLLEDITMINMADVGGQPTFLEMLPALTISPALYLLFFRLDQELTKQYPVQFHAADSRDAVTLEGSYCSVEVLHQSLSSIACFGCHSLQGDAGSVSKPQASSRVMIFGTYKDRVNEKEILEKDDALKKMFVETKLYKEGILLKSTDGKLFFTIDNMCGTEESEMSGIRKDIEQIIKNHFPPIPIPASWLIFRIALHLLNKPVVSLVQCKEIAKELHISSSVEEVLWFFHHEIGSLMHYSDIPSLNDIVICTPQVVFDCISKLIINKFQHSNRALKPCEVDDFYRKGEFRLSHVSTDSAVGQSEVDSSLTPKQLVDLLKHRNILAEIKPDQDTDQSEPKFIIPAVLKYASEGELMPPCVPETKTPLMIHFEGGFVPFGVFCASIAHLIAHQDAMSPKWKLICTNEIPVYRNKVTFSIDGSFYATLISQPHHLKVSISRRPRARCRRSLSDICSNVRHVVVKTLKTVISNMTYKPLVRGHLNSSQQVRSFELAFVCCLEDSHCDHPMKVIEDESGRYAKCLKEDDTQIDLSDEHLIWFGEVNFCHTLEKKNWQGNAISS